MMAAKDAEITMLEFELKLAREFYDKVGLVGPFQMRQLLEGNACGSVLKMFRGCYSADPAYWSRATAVFPEATREACIFRACNRVVELVRCRLGPTDRSQVRIQLESQVLAISGFSYIRI